MTDIQDMLTEEFEVRRRSERSYSWRSFAGDLGVSATFLSRIVTGKRNLSDDRAADMVNRLGWHQRKAKTFLTLVRLKASRTPAARNLIREELDAIESGTAPVGTAGAAARKPYKDVSPDTFKIIAKWYHSAILELVTVEGFKPQPRWIAKTLGIGEVEAELALDRLLKVGLVKRSGGNLIVVDEGVTVGGDVPSAAIREVHRETLKIAAKALDEQPLEHRDFSTVIVATNEHKIAEARTMIAAFRRELVAMLNSGPKTILYQVAVQLFRVSR